MGITSQLSPTPHSRPCWHCSSLALRGLRVGCVPSPPPPPRARAGSCGGRAPSRAAKPCAASTGGPRRKHTLASSGARGTHPLRDGGAVESGEAVRPERRRRRHGDGGRAGTGPRHHVRHEAGARLERRVRAAAIAQPGRAPHPRGVRHAVRPRRAGAVRRLRRRADLPRSGRHVRPYPISPLSPPTPA